MSHDQSFLDNVCTDIVHLDQKKLFYYKGNYSMFKKMLVQKRREQLKEYEKQEKRIRDLKSHGQSKKAAEKKQKETLTRKQEKNKTKQQKQEEDDQPAELLAKPREYLVKFRFPDPPPLQPPILGLLSKWRIRDLRSMNHSNPTLVCRHHLQLRGPEAAVHQDRLWHRHEQSCGHRGPQRSGQIHVLETVAGRVGA